MTIEESLRQAARRFRNAGFESPRLEAEVLMAHLLKTERLELLLHGDKALTAAQIESFQALLARRLKHEPAAQIVGHREFMGLDFVVTKDVLVPRPDTENIVEAALAVMDRQNEPMRSLDLCCGSGAIGLSLLYSRPQTQMTLSDISSAALDVARENAARLNLHPDFILSDGFAQIGGVFDIIVTNPPYIPSAQIGTLASDVRDFEPRLALDGGEDGFDFYRRLFNDAPDHLAPDGYLILECGCDQTADLKRLAGSVLHCERVIKDLAGLDRGLVLKRIE